MKAKSKSSEQPTIERLAELQDLLLRFRNIDRVIYVRKNKHYVHENDVEHSYFLAMFTWYLSPHFPNLDRDKAIKLALVHDMVEIHAGDTYTYTKDQAQIDSKYERERKAAAVLKQDWADFSEMNEYIAAYEGRDNDEAKFVYVLDKMIPSLINIVYDGYSWKKMKITLDMHKVNKSEKVQAYQDLLPIYYKLNEYLDNHLDLLYNSAKK